MFLRNSNSLLRMEIFNQEMIAKWCVGLFAAATKTLRVVKQPRIPMENDMLTNTVGDLFCHLTNGHKQGCFPVIPYIAQMQGQDGGEMAVEEGILGWEK